ncbi:MerC domain-containing protein [Flavobacterium poyangense]|uniref:MerC domain-containing protein n=1 Tax=Flavobacterium poyangense TaxID=2204302 RepID=UPI0014241F93|nr:MerC domain-containing protein [Flavobacterium sp. JXAS1]
MKKTTTSIYDILGISSATVCLVHCLIFPLLAIMPLGLSHDPFIDLVFVVIGLYAVLKIIKKTSLLVSAILIVSLTLIWINVLTEIFLEIHLNVIFIGGVGMIIGHFLNYRAHKN